MNDYEILLALSALEIARHRRVVFFLRMVRGCKAALRDEIVAEIAWRREQITELHRRRHSFRHGVYNRNRGQKRWRNVTAAYEKNG